MRHALLELVDRIIVMEAGRVIVDGPNALGEYWILPAGQSVETVATVLRDAGVIASFAIDHRPRVR